MKSSHLTQIPHVAEAKFVDAATDPLCSHEVVYDGLGEEHLHLVLQRDLQSSTPTQRVTAARDSCMSATRSGAKKPKPYNEYHGGATRRGHMYLHHREWLR